MAVIRCTPGADGKLAPVAVEFEPGDLVQLQSGSSTATSYVVLEVRSNFSLDNLSGNQDSLTIPIGLGDSVTPTPTTPTPHPKIPPPPIGDGAFMFGRGSSTGNSIKLVIEAPTPTA
jgi:hypothetical protein